MGIGEYMKKNLVLALLFICLCDIAVYALRPVHGIVDLRNNKEELTIYGSLKKFVNFDKVKILGVKGNLFRVEADPPRTDYAGYVHAGYIKVDKWEDDNTANNPTDNGVIEDKDNFKTLFDHNWNYKPISNFEKDLAEYRKELLKDYKPYTLGDLTYAKIKEAYDEAKQGKILKYNAVENAISSCMVYDKKKGGKISLQDCIGMSIFNPGLSSIQVSRVMEKSIEVREAGDNVLSDQLDDFTSIMTSIVVLRFK